MITTAVCDVAKLAMMDGLHRTGDDYRIALYGKTAELGAQTKAYSPKGECAGLGYHEGGKGLVGRRAVLVNGVACLTFNDVAWSRCTLEAHGALIYNATRNNAALATIAFETALHAHNGELALDFPTATPDTAVVAIA